jgi:DNA-binding LacI/PurR family transcriptional regulator
METGIRPGTRYQALADSLRRQIISGQHAPGHLLASEHELARQRKVSRVTVRRASEILIREGLLERRPGKGLYVLQAPTVSSDNLIRPLPLQVIAGNLSWASCLQAGRGVQAAARADGAEVRFHDAHGSENDDIEMIRRLPMSQAVGAVIVSLHSASFIDALFSLKQADFPFVLVDQRLRDLDVPSVVSDNRDGGRQIATHLLGLGHRRMAFIGDLEADTVQARLDGVRDAIGDAGLPFDRTLVRDLSPTDRLGDWSPAVHAAMESLLAHAHPPSAIIASCDAIARAVYTSARRHALHVPRDLSVVGFDDDPLAALLDPPLTTIRQPFQDLGRAAYDLVRLRIAHPTAAIDHRVLPVELVIRTSTAPCRNRP